MTLDKVVTFLDTTPKTQSMKEIINKLDFIKIKNVYSVKDNFKIMRCHHILRENIWEKHI